MSFLPNFSSTSNCLTCKDVWSYSSTFLSNFGFSSFKSYMKIFVLPHKSRTHCIKPSPFVLTPNFYLESLIPGLKTAICTTSISINQIAKIYPTISMPTTLKTITSLYVLLIGIGTSQISLTSNSRSSPFLAQPFLYGVECSSNFFITKFSLLPLSIIMLQTFFLIVPCD